jgi:hypothetical protein
MVSWLMLPRLSASVPHNRAPLMAQMEVDGATALCGNRRLHRRWTTDRFGRKPVVIGNA